MAFELRDYQKETLESLQGHLAFDDKAVIPIPGGGGKEQPYSEPVLTPDGWTTMGELNIGDNVIGSDGKAKQIIQIHEQGIKDVYSVNLSNGTSVRCGNNHLWTYIKDGYKYTKNIKTIIDDVNKKRFDKRYNSYHFAKRYSIQLPKAVLFNNKNILPIEPMAFGILIGDGSFRSTTIRLSNNSSTIKRRVEKALCKNDRFTNHRILKNKYDVSISSPGRKQNDLSKKIENLKLNGLYSYEKFIPSIYMKSSIKNRIKLLYGLLLTDGHRVRKGYFEYSTSSKQLGEDVLELTRSLGLYSIMSIKEKPIYKSKNEIKIGRTSYRIFINFNKKQVSIINIEKLDYKENSKCISIDSKDNLYITTGYTLTHNSAIAAELARIADEENSHLVILTNMTALIPQLARHLDEFNVEYNVIKAGYDKIWNPNAKITLIMEQSFHEKRRLKNDVKCDILIKDEMHIGIGQKRYEDIVRHLNPDKTIGMTFTPINESGYLMHGIKTENIVTTVSVKDLIGLGYLVPTKVFVPQWAEKIEYEGVNTSGADFNGKEIDKIVNEDEHISLTIQSMNQMDAKNKKTLVYASSIGHADALLLALTEQGYATALVHSEMPSDHNAEEISRFKDEWAEQADLFDGTKNQRKVDCLISVMALSVGFDSPQARLLVLLRPTKVLRLYLQIAARVARPAEGKEYAELLDLAQCTRRLGFSDEPIKYVEQGNKKELTEEKEDREATAIRLLAGDEPTEITRDVVVTKLKELKQKSQNVSTMTVSDLTALYDTSNSIDLILNIAYEMNLRKYGLSYSKKDVMTVATHWHSMIEEFPEHRNRLLKTLRTMSKRKVSENKKLFALFYVARKPDGWLWTLPPYVYALQDEFQTKEEEEEAYEYYKGYEIEIDEEEIPF